MPGGFTGGGGDEVSALTKEIEELWEHIRELEKPSGSSRVFLRDAVETFPGVPPGGYRGALLARDVGGNLQWTTPIGSIVPKYYIYLEDGASDYEVNTYGSFTTQDTAKTMLPAPLFEYNKGAGGDVTQMDWPISWADETFSWGGPQPLESDPMPIQLEIYLRPHFEGQKFEIALPSSWMGSGGAPWFTVVIYNDSAFTADLALSAEALVYDGGIPGPWRMDLAPEEYFTWKVDNVWFDAVARVQPFWQSMGLVGGGFAGVPLDNWYWKNVRALEHEQSFSVAGELTTVVGEHRFYNGRNQTVRVGKLVASVGGGVPTGSGIEIVALLNGVTPIFLTPLVIPAGGDYVEGVPDTGGVSMLSNWVVPPGDVVVLLKPAEFITVNVPAVGGDNPGSSLTVQLFYG